MQIIVPTAGRAATHTTAKLLPAGSYRYLVHSEAEAAEYRAHAAATGLAPAAIVVTNTPPGNADVQRRWALENLVRPKAWVLMLDDDIRGFTAVPDAYWEQPDMPVEADPSYYQKVYDLPATIDRFLGRVGVLAAECDRVGARLGGFASLRNAFFRSKQWRYVAYVESTLALVKNDDPADWPVGYHMEDFAATAHHLRRYGTVVVNNFAFPVNTHYIAGGLGPAPERVALRRRAIARLMAEYPDLFRVVEKKGGITDLRLRFHSPKQIAKWRAGLR